MQMPCLSEKAPLMPRFFLLILFVAGAFVWLTSGGLPPVVASHFGPGGTANGFMGKGVYVALMIALVVTVPGLIASTALLVRMLPPQMINLPHKSHWLAPERRAATLDALASLSVRFAGALAAFLCFVHWLVVRANAVQPPRLAEGCFVIGLAGFGAAMLAWLFLLYRRFGRVP